MYCPVCFNDTLKIASSGVVKVTFNGKAKSTSQFLYNMKTEKPLDIFKKYRGVVADYFSWYATFQNKDMVKEVELTSSDFVCSTGCKLNINHRLSIIDLVIPKEMFKEITESEAQRYEIPLKLKLK
tara:strand:- start:1582 stop:1959 length:378 start_codon:yes stop_codon:yes gene_type:complete